MDGAGGSFGCTSAASGSILRLQRAAWERTRHTAPRRFEYMLNKYTEIVLSILRLDSACPSRIYRRILVSFHSSSSLSLLRYRTLKISIPPPNSITIPPNTPKSHATSLYSSPFLASSTLRAASPSAKPPLETQTRLPSASSSLSSCWSQAQGQWCGKWTQARVSGQR